MARCAPPATVARSAAVATTINGVLPEIPLTVAVAKVRPAILPVTMPDVSTSATLVSSRRHCAMRPITG